jgi:hypothetical protein
MEIIDYGTNRWNGFQYWEGAERHGPGMSDITELVMEQLFMTNEKVDNGEG